MEVIVLPTAADVDVRAADLVAEQVVHRPDTVLGVATGSSPLGTYRELARRQTEGSLDLSKLLCFALDEYVGLPASDPAAYAEVLGREVAGPFGLPPSRVRVPDGSRRDLEQACRDYEEAIGAAGGIDLQLLGIGANGHIGFNEPTSSLSSRTRVKALSARTRADNARFFDDPADVPSHCVTQGLGTILEARQVLLVAQGKRKAAAVAAAVEGPVAAMCPASVLQLHRSVTVVMDEAAAGDLALIDYYRFVAEAKHRLRQEDA
ncbi:glucosamine-6-phosphate deaminase [Kocuria turfanensis]|uniref:Glucosamine-6-phosphate deaminase n=1 Tax=Kocuria turfanensis TaxID=388357 RepID=A0A512IER4_9MICC|nr:glucosamine-6-phosphate deaminase [Kocuria turfanensis]GEO96171.1 glucosamine-6-phosphate deaminase [Kocuria turfanensis]